MDTLHLCPTSGMASKKTSKTKSEAVCNSFDELREHCSIPCGQVCSLIHCKASANQLRETTVTVNLLLISGTLRTIEPTRATCFDIEQLVPVRPQEDPS